MYEDVDASTSDLEYAVGFWVGGCVALALVAWGQAIKDSQCKYCGMRFGGHQRDCWSYPVYRDLLRLLRGPL